MPRIDVPMRDLCQLYCPPDVDAAHTTWGANCGPAALAAILHLPLRAVPALSPEFAARGYLNPSTMLVALARAGHHVLRQARGAGNPWPLYGLGFVQWHGPWLAPGVPLGAAYRHTHWIGIAQTTEHGTMVYDINTWQASGHRGAWVPLPWWEQEVVPAITAEVPRATGDWHLRWSCAVTFPTIRKEISHA